MTPQWASWHVLLPCEREDFVMDVNYSPAAHSTWIDFISENLSMLGLLMLKTRMERNHEMRRRYMDNFTDEPYNTREILIMTMINPSSFKSALPDLFLLYSRN